MATIRSIKRKLPWYTREDWNSDKENLIKLWITKVSGNFEGLHEVYGHCKNAPESIKNDLWDEMISACNNLKDFETLYFLYCDDDHEEELLKKVDILCVTASDIDNIIDIFEEESSFYQQLLQKRNQLT